MALIRRKFKHPDLFLYPFLPLAEFLQLDNLVRFERLLLSHLGITGAL
jgi:hypothetical protein